MCALRRRVRSTQFVLYGSLAVTVRELKRSPERVKLPVHRGRKTSRKTIAKARPLSCSGGGVPECSISRSGSRLRRSLEM
ncbi:hypothetical protein GN956_G6869 [Arapaima gigas]